MPEIIDTAYVAVDADLKLFKKKLSLINKILKEKIATLPPLNITLKITNAELTKIKDKLANMVITPTIKPKFVNQEQGNQGISALGAAAIGGAATRALIPDIDGGKIGKVFGKDFRSETKRKFGDVAKDFAQKFKESFAPIASKLQEVVNNLDLSKPSKQMDELISKFKKLEELNNKLKNQLKMEKGSPIVQLGTRGKDGKFKEGKQYSFPKALAKGLTGNIEILHRHGKELFKNIRIVGFWHGKLAKYFGTGFDIKFKVPNLKEISTKIKDVFKKVFYLPVKIKDEVSNKIKSIVRNVKSIQMLLMIKDEATYKVIQITKNIKSLISSFKEKLKIRFDNSFIKKLSPIIQNIKGVISRSLTKFKPLVAIKFVKKGYEQIVSLIKGFKEKINIKISPMFINSLKSTLNSAKSLITNFTNKFAKITIRVREQIGNPFKKLGSFAVASAAAITAVFTKALRAITIIAATATGAFLGINKAITVTLNKIEALARVESVIKSTGGAAGYTTKQLQQMANAIEDTTNFDDKEILKAQSVLLTFSKIRGPTFEKTLKSATDIATVFEQDIISTVKQLGKALNNPITGMTALRKLGVAFTNEQEKEIENLIAQNNLAAAQAVILEKINNKVGGAAEAIKSPMNSVKNAWEDVTESISLAVVRFFRIQEIAPQVTQSFKNIAQSIDNISKGDTFRKISASVLFFGDVTRLVFSNVISNFSLLGNFFSKMIKGIFEGWRMLGNFIVDIFGGVWDKVIGGAKKFLSYLGGLFGKAVDFISYKFNVPTFGKEFSKSFNDFIDDLGIGKFVDSFKNLGKEYDEIKKKFEENVKNPIQDFNLNDYGNLSNQVNDLTDDFEDLKESISNQVNDLTDDFEDLKESISSIGGAESRWDDFLGKIQKTSELIKMPFKIDAPKIPKIETPKVDDLKNKVGNLFDKQKSELSVFANIDSPAAARDVSWIDGITGSISDMTKQLHTDLLLINGSVGRMSPIGA